MRALLLPADRSQRASNAALATEADDTPPVSQEKALPSTAFLPAVLTPSSGGHDEAWLQKLLFDHPELLPMDRIEPGTGPVVPLCRELPLARVGGAVFLDMLGVTRAGRLVLVECKLWRNPQARREVVAQVIEYSGLLRGWSYGDLTARLKQRMGWQGANPIVEHARQWWPDLDEAAFVDGVSRSMEIGDFHLIIAGDGIRSDVQVLARQVNEAGARARLSLVEIQLWHAANGATIVLPCVPMRTEVIEQRVFVADNGQALRVQEQRVDDPNPLAAGSNNRAISNLNQDVDPNRALNAARNKEFWSRFIATVRFDHPEQESPSHGGNNWVKIPLGGDERRLTAYRAADNTMGVFFRLNGDNDAGLGEALFGELDGLQSESGLDLRLASAGKGRGQGDIIVTASTLELSEQAQLDWLCNAAKQWWPLAQRRRLTLS